MHIYGVIMSNVASYAFMEGIFLGQNLLISPPGYPPDKADIHRISAEYPDRDGYTNSTPYKHCP